MSCLAYVITYAYVLTCKGNVFLNFLSKIIPVFSLLAFDMTMHMTMHRQLRQRYLILAGMISGFKFFSKYSLDFLIENEEALYFYSYNLQN